MQVAAEPACTTEPFGLEVTRAAQGYRQRERIRYTICVVGSGLIREPIERPP